MSQHGCETVARLYHDMFLRRGAFEVIRRENMPCTSRARLAIPYIGKEAAAQRTLRRYLYKRACLLGLRQAFQERLLERHEAIFPRESWPEDFAGLVPYPPYVRLAPDYRVIVRETRNVMRSVERRLLVTWQCGSLPGKEGNTYQAPIVDGTLFFGSSLGPSDPYPRNLGLSFNFAGGWATYLHFDEDLFFVDIETYLPLYHIPLSEFQRRYELLVGLIEVIRQELAP